MRSVIIASILAPLALAACGDDPAAGTLTVTVYGEEFIEEGIPATVFSDGWAVDFDTFLVTFGGAAAKAGEDAAEITVPQYLVFDLARPSGGAGFTLGTVPAPGGTYDHFGYRIRPDASAIAGNADAADATALVASGASMRVVGTATKGATTIAFDWSFAKDLSHAHCEVDDDVDGNAVTMQATIHGDHLFYDDLVSTDPNVAFDLIAASDGADGSAPDGTVTLAELAAQDLTGEERYQVGSFPVTDLRAFIEHQAGTVGHVNGEGHCEDILDAPLP